MHIDQKTNIVYTILSLNEMLANDFYFTIIVDKSFLLADTPLLWSLELTLNVTLIQQYAFKILNNNSHHKTTNDV